MPVCPGCERTVSYDRLPVHQRYCEGIWGADGDENPDIRRIEQQLMDLEQRLSDQLAEHEAAMESRLLDLEKDLQAQKPAPGE